MSKGSTRRPIDPHIERKVFEDNWDRIFNREKKDLSYESDNPIEKPFEPQPDRVEEKVGRLEEDYAAMYEFIQYIAKDYIELSHEKVRIQRDDYVRMARDLMKQIREENES